MLPYIMKEKQTDNVKYKSFKIDDIWKAIQPKMNELGVNTRVVSENSASYETYERKTYNGTETMFLYQSDITIHWVNAEDPNDKIEKQIHAIGSNNDPAKAKGAAHTYVFKYDLCYMFSVPMGDIDPDSFDTDQDEKNKKAERRLNDIKMSNDGHKKTIIDLLKQLNYTKITAPERMIASVATSIFDDVTEEGALILIASLNKEVEDNKNGE